MIISCTKEDLHQAVQIVQKAVPSKAAVPILAGIYLSARNDTLELQSTDYEISIRCRIPAVVQEPGAIVLSGRYLQDIVRRLPGDTVEISTNHDDNTIKIISKQAQFNLLYMPPEEFPILKPLVSDNSMVLPDEVLSQLIKKTVFACSNDEARPIFTGALLEADEQGIRMVATNTHRLALQAVSDTAATPLRIIIPSKILSELVRLLAGDEPRSVTLYWQRSQIAFEFDNVYIISRLIEGQFPDYQKVIPVSFATVVTVKTDDFMSAVNLISLLAKDGDYNVLKFSFREDDILITSNNPEVGKAKENVAAVIEGPMLDIAFNVNYINDIVKNIDTEEMIICMNTPLSPVCIRQQGDERYTYIVTPVRTN